MRWQDKAIAIAGLIFSVGLIPTVIGSTYPPAITSLAMVAGLSLVLAAVWSLSLRASMVSTALQWSLWLVVLVRSL